MTESSPRRSDRSIPRFHMIGNAHVDPAWMWGWAEGLEAFIATCRSALDRIAETVDHAAEHRVADWHVDDAPGAAHHLAFADAVALAHHRGLDPARLNIIFIAWQAPADIL